MALAAASTGTIALDDVIALTDEMAALVRAGVPLETGLARSAVDLARRPGKIAAAVSQRLERGEDLQHVVESMPDVFPPAYCAVIAAGRKSGRLAAALEGLATTSRRAADLRRLTRTALIYPLFVAFAAYLLFAYGLVAFQPRVEKMYQVMQHEPSQFNLMLVDLGRGAEAWLPWIPAIAFFVIACWWYRSTRSTVGSSGRWSLGPAGRMLYYGRLSTLLDMLGLLVENGCTMPEAISLAAQTCGDNRLRAAAEQFSNRLTRGEMLSAAIGENRRDWIAGIPPLVQWLIAGGGNQQVLAASLRNTAEAYRRRAIRLDDWLRLYLPIALTLGIGGTAVAIYAISMLGPWYQMLTHIGYPAK